MIRRFLAAIARRVVQPDPTPERKAPDAAHQGHPDHAAAVNDYMGRQVDPVARLRPAAAAGAIHKPSLPTDVLPVRIPRAALNAAVARYVTDGLPLYPADELLIAPSGALIHVHHLTAEEIS